MEDGTLNIRNFLVLARLLGFLYKKNVYCEKLDIVYKHVFFVEHETTSTQFSDIPNRYQIEGHVFHVFRNVEQVRSFPTDTKYYHKVKVQLVR